MWNFLFRSIRKVSAVELSTVCRDLIFGVIKYYPIPANLFLDISVRVFSWEYRDFWRRHDHFRRFPKKSEVFRRRPKSAEGEVIEKTLIHKIRDRKEGIVIYSFYTWFSFLTWVWVNICLKIVSSKTATTHIRRESLAGILSSPLKNVISNELMKGYGTK